VTIPESFSFAFEDPVFSICCSLVNFAIYTFTPKEQKQAVAIIYGTKWSWGAWIKKGKGSPYSVTEHRVPELILVLGSQPAGDVSHKPGSRLPLLSARPAVTPTTLTRAATNFAVWWTEARWVWTVCLRLLRDSFATAIWTQVLLRLSPARVPLGYRATLISK